MSCNFVSFRHLTALAAVTLSWAALAGDAPIMAQGIQLGDVSNGRAIVWSRADRPSRNLKDIDGKLVFSQKLNAKDN